MSTQEMISFIITNNKEGLTREYLEEFCSWQQINLIYNSLCKEHQHDN